MFYAAFSFGLLSVAYAGVGPKLLMKTSSGRRPLLAIILFGPYFLLNTWIFTLYRLVSGEPAYTQVLPELVIGRRLLAGECGSISWPSVLDLTAEFSEARPLAALPGYRLMPVLDATAPSPDQLRTAVSWIQEAIAGGPVYVHCALGHGRSACIVIAYLLSTGRFGTVDEAVSHLQSLRPKVHLNSDQYRGLVEFAIARANAPEGLSA